MTNADFDEVERSLDTFSKTEDKWNLALPALHAIRELRARVGQLSAVRDARKAALVEAKNALAAVQSMDERYCDRSSKAAVDSFFERRNAANESDADRSARFEREARESHERSSNMQIDWKRLKPRVTDALELLYALEPSAKRPTRSPLNFQTFVGPSPLTEISDELHRMILLVERGLGDPR